MTENRQAWDNSLQFFFACISFAVGLGNVWRFPYLCQMHGGGSFLIPYLIMLILEGMPLLYLELAVGQQMRKGSVGSWKIVSPYLIGVGIASVVVSFLIIVYYNVVIAWSFWYFFHSFQDPLPWATCPTNSNHTGYVNECEKSSATEYFWYRETLNITSSIDERGCMQWEISACLVLAWLVIYLCILKGTKSTGKVVYVTACLPYVVLIIYLGRGLTLHGAINGLVYMFTPKINELKNPKTWVNAATQIFFSLGLGFGSLIAFASYNQPDTNCEKHAILVSTINSATSIFASIVTFSVYGFKATYNYEKCIERMTLLLVNNFDLESTRISEANLSTWMAELNSTFPEQYAGIGTEIEECSLESELTTAVQGTGLSFIVYSEAITSMPLSQLWSVLYFIMLLTLGVGSMLGCATALTTALKDVKIIAAQLSEEVITSIMCLVCCSVSLIFTFGSGNYWFEIFNDYAATLSVLLIVLVEDLAICYLYGLKRFSKDIEMMLGHKPNWYWKTMWSVISPLLIISLFIFYIVDYILTEKLMYQAWDPDLGQLVTKDYPAGAEAVIGCIIVSSIICMPLAALVIFIQKKHYRGKKTDSLI
ncbi:sodium- and chloride-dependent transporter XTRP3-like [Protopterus annectens]|uniref:sodium- and chloride-dependent transporter XTRP3-like n=1 Tax=Protopterus annectens TaxID=7888 RepID=UPI001CF971A5|nr:sodium- and chloride-dependent transporter XTRP3-like [Protopterus annectens]